MSAPGTAPEMVPAPPATRPTTRKMARVRPNWTSDANGRLIISIEPARPPYAALTPNAMALYSGRLTPLIEALVWLSRTAMSARPGRLLMKLRASDEQDDGHDDEDAVLPQRLGDAAVVGERHPRRRDHLALARGRASCRWGRR